MKPFVLEQELDLPHLTEIVRKALGKPSLRVSEWSATAVTSGVGLDSYVFRFQGTARDDGETIPWSLILKATGPSEQSMDPSGIWYWKREALAFRSGLLSRLPGGNVSGPACFEVDERADGSLWVWMEEVKDDLKTPWQLEQYALVARHLGQFNGAYLAGQPFPEEPWVSRSWLRRYVENAAPSIDFIRRNPHNPVVRHMFPGIALAQVLSIWDEHAGILDALDALPQVFCHQDAFKRNLFLRNGKTVAIDWGFAGIAPVGAELVALIAASLAFFEIPAERVMELDRACFEGYLQGLGDAGWHGNPRLVRTGYALSLMLRYPLGGQIGEMLPKFLTEQGRARVAAAFEDKSADDLERSNPVIVAYYQHLLPEALKLLGMGRLLRFFIRLGRNAVWQGAKGKQEKSQPAA